MVNAFDADGPLIVRQNRDQTIIADPELVVIRGCKTPEVSVGVLRRLLELRHDAPRAGRVEPVQVPARPLGPLG